jgi:rhodanese-related sulfurtransferase
MPVPRITREELKTRLDAGDPPVIVDARLKYPYEHSTVALPGAIRLAPESLDLPAIPAGREVVVYDSDPDEIVSAPVAARLIDKGVKAFALEGGIAEWTAANLPTDTKGDPRPAAPAAGAAKG